MSGTQELIRSLNIVPCAYLRYYYQSRDILDKEFTASENSTNRADLVAKLNISC
ncbi:hypothetical protein OK016_15045 [Vibrio chagasii]|nr:hypothetical protein [Vibrio chagasii]